MILKSTLLEPHSSLLHGFTTRELGDDYARLAKLIKASESKIVTLTQIHSNKVHVLDHPPTQPRNGLQGDAMITRSPDIVMAVRTADCVPLLVFDPEQQAMGVIHAGWKGIIAGVIENTIQTMIQFYKSRPQKMMFAVGAALCKKCFEVGPEVADQFQTKFGDQLPIIKIEGDRCAVDMREACQLILRDHGVREENIDLLPYCTSCHREKFFSYRRGDELQRQLSFIQSPPLPSLEF